MIDRAIFKAKAGELLLHEKSHARREIGWAYRHGFRTANLSLWLRERLFTDQPEMDDVLYIAGLFHDCAKTSKSDHGKAGALRAVKILKGILDEPILMHVKSAIFKHNKRGTESTDLEKILQDADIIDHFGSIEVWLNVSYSVLGQEGPERSLEFYRTEWVNMISELRGLFNYPLALQVFEERVAFNDAFRKRLEVEADGGVYR